MPFKRELNESEMDSDVKEPKMENININNQSQLLHSYSKTGNVKLVKRLLQHTNKLDIDYKMILLELVMQLVDLY